MEEWRPYPSDEGYLVSSLGRLRNLKSGKVSTGSKRPDGYWQFKIAGKNRLLHNIVLETFEGPRPEGMWGLHEDDNRDHNTCANLRWGTPIENGADRIRNSRSKGVEASNAKINREQVLEICRRIDADDAFSDIASDFGITRASVGHINTGHAWGWLTGRSSANARHPTHINHARRLTKASVIEIKGAIAAGELQKDLAERFGVRRQTISEIATGKIWSHVNGAP